MVSLNLFGKFLDLVLMTIFSGIVRKMGFFLMNICMILPDALKLIWGQTIPERFPDIPAGMLLFAIELLNGNILIKMLVYDMYNPEDVYTAIYIYLITMILEIILDYLYSAFKYLFPVYGVLTVKFLASVFILGSIGKLIRIEPKLLPSGWDLIQKSPYEEISNGLIPYVDFITQGIEESIHCIFEAGGNTFDRVPPRKMQGMYHGKEIMVKP